MGCNSRNWHPEFHSFSKQNLGPAVEPRLGDDLGKQRLLISKAQGLKRIKERMFRKAEPKAAIMVAPAIGAKNPLRPSQRILSSQKRKARRCGGSPMMIGVHPDPFWMPVDFKRIAIGVIVGRDEVHALMSQEEFHHSRKLVHE